jgi:hypothetical protein
MKDGKITLDWKDYDGTGDPSKARYILGGKDIGTGDQGIQNIKEHIRWLPSSISIVVLQYYGDAGDGIKRKYPFDINSLREYADKYGVRILIPSAG